mgnify:CR=1 FL=1
MAERITDPGKELDEDGKPIPGGEGGGKPPKIESKKDEGEAEPEIPVRKSALQQIIGRKNRQIERLRSKNEDESTGGGGKDEEDEEDSLTPEARGAVQREVAKALGPVVSSLSSKADEDELQDLLGSDPEAKKYEKRIRAYMGHESYKGVPPSVIYHHLAFDAAAGAGVRRKGAANFDAGQSRGGGRTSRPTDTGTGDVPSVEEQNEMSEAEFEALQHRARSGEFVSEEQK